MIHKYFKTIASILVVSAFLFLGFGSDKSKNNEENDKNVDCSNKEYAYSSGYASGSLCRTMGDYSSCESFVRQYNYNIGRDVLAASECYCEGFNDGKEGRPQKYNADTKVTTTDNNYSSSNDYGDENPQTSYNNQEQDSLEENKANAPNDENSNSLAAKPRFRIYDLGHSINYIEAEAECRSRGMKMPDYNELLEISTSPELLKNLKTNDRSQSYWSSTDYIDGQPFMNKESIKGDDPKSYKKNYNPFTEKTIMTDTRLTKNCICIEKLDESNIYRQ